MRLRVVGELPHCGFFLGSIFSAFRWARSILASARARAGVARLDDGLALYVMPLDIEEGCLMWFA